MKSIKLEDIVVKNEHKMIFTLEELLQEIQDTQEKCKKIPLSTFYEDIIPLHKKSKKESLDKNELEKYNLVLNQLRKYYSIKNKTRNKFERKSLIQIELQEQKEIFEYKELIASLFSKFEDFYFHISPFLENQNILYINTHSSIEEEQRDYAEKLYNFLFVVSPQGFPNGDLSCNRTYYEEIRKVDIAKEFLVGDQNSIDEYLNPKRYNESKYFFENEELIKKNVEKIKSLS